MIIHDNLFYPETVTEKDAITALKLAVNSHARHLHSSLFTTGCLRSAVTPETLRETRTLFNEVEVDRDGRDSEGIDIDAALTAIDWVNVYQSMG